MEPVTAECQQPVPFFKQGRAVAFLKCKAINKLIIENHTDDINHYNNKFKGWKDPAKSDDQQTS